MQSSKKQQKLSKAEIRTLQWRNGLIVLGVLVGLFVVTEVIGLTGQTRFYAKWVACGQRPVEERGSGIWNAGARHYSNTSALKIIRGKATYYCTPLEAEKAGVSASPEKYEFPHIEAERVQEDENKTK